MNLPNTSSILIKSPNGDVRFLIFSNGTSHEIAKQVFEGQSYPIIQFVENVNTIVDIGANIGAASLYFMLHYPNAKMYCFEPFPDSFELLKVNLAGFTNARVFNFGLHDHDETLPIYVGTDDSVTNSIYSSAHNTRRSVEAQIRNAKQVFGENEITAIDLLKIDTEGCEIPILKTIADILPQVQIMYVEYHNEADRIAIDEMMRPTHILFYGKIHTAHLGELCYVRYDSSTHQELIDTLKIVRR